MSDNRDFTMRWRTDLYGQRFVASTPRWMFSRDICRMHFMHHHAKRIDWEADVTQAAETSAFYTCTISHYFFISVCDNKYHGAHNTSAGVPRLVTWRIEMTMTRCRAIRHETSGFSSRPRKTKPRRRWREHRNRTRDYTDFFYIRG